MLQTRTEYTPGQMIRFEAIALSHSATRLRDLMLESRPELDLLDVPAAAAMNSVRRNAQGELSGINRRQKHYEDLIGALERAREEVEALPASGNTPQAWRLLNRCRHHSMTILGMMEQRAAAVRTGGPGE